MLCCIFGRFYLLTRSLEKITDTNVLIISFSTLNIFWSILFGCNICCSRGTCSYGKCECYEEDGVSLSFDVHDIVEVIWSFCLLLCALYFKLLTCLISHLPCSIFVLSILALVVSLRSHVER